MISQVYFIMLPTVTFYLANLLVSYHLSFLLFFIRAPNPLSRWLLEILWLTGSPEEKGLHFALKLLEIFFGLYSICRRKRAAQLSVCRSINWGNSRPRSARLTASQPLG